MPTATRGCKSAYYKTRLFIQVPRDLSLSGVLITTPQYTGGSRPNARVTSTNLTTQHLKYALSRLEWAGSTPPRSERPLLTPAGFEE